MPNYTMRLAALALLLLFIPMSLLARGRNEQDDDFVDAMILHHQHGIDIARIAVDKAHHDELRTMAQHLIAHYEQDIARLGQLRDNGEQRGRAELADMPGMIAIDAEWLRKKSGNDFDLAFLTAMGEHHLGAIRMSTDEQRSGADSEVKQLARAIAAKHRAEREQMLRWRQEWK